MAKKAIDSGVDVVKHQTHIVEDEMSSQAEEKIHTSERAYELMEDVH